MALNFPKTPVSFLCSGFTNEWYVQVKKKKTLNYLFSRDTVSNAQNCIISNVFWSEKNLLTIINTKKAQQCITNKVDIFKGQSWSEVSVHNGHWRKEPLLSLCIVMF